MIPQAINATLVLIGWFAGACVLLWQSLYTLRTGDIYWGFRPQFETSDSRSWWYRRPAESLAGRIWYALIYGGPATAMFFILGGELKKILVALVIQESTEWTSLALWSALCGMGGTALLATALFYSRRRSAGESEWPAWVLRGAAAVIIAGGLRIILQM